MTMNAQLAQAYLAEFPDEAVRLLEARSGNEIADLLHTLPPAHVAQLCARTLPLNAAGWLRLMEETAAAGVLAAMDREVAIRVLRHIPAERRTVLLSELHDDDSSLYNCLLRYGDHQVGGHMDPVAMALREDLSLREAQEQARQYGTAALAFPYVVDGNQRLVGILTIRAVMTASPDAKLMDIMRRDIKAVPAGLDLNQARSLQAWQELEVLPVVDAHDVLLGSVRCRVVDQEEQQPVAAGEPAPLFEMALSLTCLYVENLQRFVPDMITVGSSLLAPDSTEQVNK